MPARWWDRPLLDLPSWPGVSEGRESGFVLVAILVLWVVGVAAAVSGIELGDGDAPAAEPTTPAASPRAPAEIPTQLVLRGAGTDGSFAADSTIVYEAWIGTPIGVDSLDVRVARLSPEPYSVSRRLTVEVDPAAVELRGELPAGELLGELGPGAYVVAVYLEDDSLLAGGALRLATSVPDEVEVFLGWRDVQLAAGSHVGYRFDAEGSVSSEQSLDLTEATTVPANLRAVFSGQAYFLVVQGALEFYWLPENERAMLADS